VHGYTTRLYFPLIFRYSFPVVLRKYIYICIRLLIKNRSDYGLTEEPKPEPRRYVNCVTHDGGLNICATFHCTRYGNKQRFLCVCWGSGPCIIPGMQRPGRETSHSSPSTSAARMDVAIPSPAHFRVYTQLLVVNLTEFAGQPIGLIFRGVKKSEKKPQISSTWWWKPETSHAELHL
jgi:hypothetical protein